MAVGEEIYSGAAQFGRIWTYIGAVIASIASVVLVGFGIYLIYQHSRLHKTVGNVLADSTKHSQYNPDTKQTFVYFSTPVSWIVEKNHYQGVLTSQGPYKSGQNVDIYYEAGSPQQGTLEPVPAWAGGAAIGAAVFISLVAWAWVYITRRYKFVAAAAGVRDVYSLVK